MKKSELKKYIKEVILAELAEKSIDEATYVGAEAITALQSNPKFAASKDKVTPINTLRAGGSVTLENEEEPTETEIKKEKSLTKAQTQWAKITKELKSNMDKTKSIISKKPADRTKADEAHLAKMKELTQYKNKLKVKFTASELEDED